MDTEPARVEHESTDGIIGTAEQSFQMLSLKMLGRHLSSPVVVVASFMAFLEPHINHHYDWFIGVIMVGSIVIIRRICCCYIIIIL